MLQCAVSDADIVTGVVCHASTFLISAGNTATPAYPVANRTLDAVWICTTQEPYTAHVIGTRTHSAHPMFLLMCRSTSVAYLFAYASNSHVDGFREMQITNNLFPFSVYM